MNKHLSALIRETPNSKTQCIEICKSNPACLPVPACRQARWQAGRTGGNPAGGGISFQSLLWGFKPMIFVLLLGIMFNSCESLEEYGPDSIYDTWYCLETSEVYGQTNYYVDLSKHPSEDGKIILDNFYNLGLGKEVIANHSGLSISIPSQVVDGNAIAGSGTIASDYKTIDFTYVVDDGGGVDHVTAQFKRL